MDEIMIERCWAELELRCDGRAMLSRVVIDATLAGYLEYSEVAAIREEYKLGTQYNNIPGWECNTTFIMLMLAAEGEL